MNKTELAKKINSLEGLSAEERTALLDLLRAKSYGLVWEDKPEAVEDEMRQKLPVLKEVPSRAILSDDPEAPNHILIEGDNLHALTALSYTHAGKIDVIYIDPPYNTGNKDFKYNDKYVDTKDSFRHSKWLAFMSKRLRIAKALLSQKGLLFISIDDNEQAQLKILCDEVFGFNNFVNCVSIKAKASSGASGGGEDKKLKKNIEYVLIYTNSFEDALIKFPVEATPLMEYIEDKREKGITWSYTNVMLNEGIKHYVKSIEAGNGDEIKIFEVTDYEIISVSSLANRLNKTEEEIYTEYIDKIFTTENAQTSIRTRVANAINGDGLYIAQYKPKSGRNKGKLTDVGFIGATKRLVSYLKYTCQITDRGIFKLGKIGTLWTDLSWSSISKEGGVAFPQGKKPISLIQRVIDMVPKEDAVVLDFFAGSGSSAHAVMALNEIDGGKRVAIIITNNENSICEEITYSRISNVIHGYRNAIPLEKNSLRYYKTDFVGRENNAKNRRELVMASTDLLCIKNDIYAEWPLNGNRLNPKYARYFEDNRGRMLVVYQPQAIKGIVELIAQMPKGEEKMKVYVFSHGTDTYADDFASVGDRVELCALPKAILDAYSKVLPRRQPKYLPEELVQEIIEAEQHPQTEALGGLFGDVDDEKGGEQ